MWQPSQSSGREPYVFNVDTPQDLLGVHAGLMEEALRPDEELRYLLYSPICQVKEGPFGLHGTPSSHAVAVTSDRFVISENQHREGTVPSVQSIPFQQVLYAELGAALLLGWFSLKFVLDDKPSCTTLFFSATTGMKHFGIAIREYRRMTGPAYDRLPVAAIGWTNIWRHTPKTEVEYLKPLVLGEELPFNILRSSERWIQRKKRRKSIPVCLSTNGILVSTNFWFMYAKEEKPIRPDIYSFGVNVSCIPANSVKSVRIVEKGAYGDHLFVLKQEITREGVIVEFDIVFDDSSLKGAETLVYFLTKGMRGQDRVCIS